MKKSLRYYIALLVGKTAYFFLGLLGKNAFYPGKFTYLICPDFLGMIELPETVVAVTGTNGKTTVTNLLADCLREEGYDLCSNVFGSNTVAAQISLLLGATSWGGRAKRRMALLEVDEKSTDKIFKYIRPRYLICTNLFRDSYKNNGHVEYIASILEANIPPETTLILNADDPVSSRLRPDNPRRYFGLAPLAGEREERASIVKDAQNCPECGRKLSPVFVRYHHIGRYRCPHCGFRSPEADYEVVAADFAAKRLTLRQGEALSQFDFPLQNDTDLYNAAAAIALLRELGLANERVQALFRGLEVTKTRFDRSVIGAYSLTLMMAKGSNPVATSRVFDYLRKQEGAMAVLIMNHEVIPQERNVVFTAWYHETDMRYLAEANVAQIVAVGKQNQDLKAALLLAGVDEAKVSLCRAIADGPKQLDLAAARHIYVLYDTETQPLAAALKPELEARLRAATEAGLPRPDAGSPVPGEGEAHEEGATR